jgi:SAM-dependent methyltransferase
MDEWWKSFFDADYLHLWEGAQEEARTEREAVGLWSVLGLKEGDRVLDAPCGYGRIASALARRGATVVGLDFSAALLAEAERRRGDMPTDRLRYIRGDLRVAIEESEFDAAVNIFTSLGYGTEEDDIAILSTLRNAVRSGGRVFVETAHRDRMAVALSHTERHASRLADGTLMVEEPKFDAVTGRVESSWCWSGPGGNGQKRSSLRMYCATELVALLRRAGLRMVSVHAGCSPEPFVGAGSAMSGRLGLLAERD